MVGGGFVAVEEGLFLTRYARRIYGGSSHDFSIHLQQDELKSHEKVVLHILKLRKC